MLPTRSWLVLSCVIVLTVGCRARDDMMAPDTPEVGPADTITLSDLAIAFASIGETLQLTATVQDADGNTLSDPTVTWESLATGVATVTPSGLVTAIADGMTQVRATSGEAVTVADVTVEQVATSITASVDTLVLPGPGEVEQLTANVLDAIGSPVVGAGVSWEVDDTGVATIDAFGNVTGVAPGTTTARASAAGGSVILTAEVTVVVNALSMGVDDFCGDFTPDAEPAFASSGFEDAVRDKLGIGPADTMTCAMLATIDSMRVPPVAGSIVTSLRGGQNLVGLDTLFMAAHAFSDLAPLGQLPELAYLNVANGSVDDAGLAGIASLASLRNLQAAFNDVSDLSPLSGLTGLEVLNIGNSMLSSLAPLTSLTALEELLIGSSMVSDLTPIAGLSNLEVLIAGRTDIVDLSPISGLTGLRDLVLNDNAISDVSPLSGMVNLERLWIQRNPGITSVSALSGLTSLVEFDGDQNAMASLDGMQGWSSIEEIDITDNPVTDLGPLAGLTTVTRLEALALGAGFNDVSPLETMTGLAYLNLGSNGSLSNVQPLIDNTGLGAGDEVILTLTAVNCTSANALRANGVTVTLPGCPG